MTFERSISSIMAHSMASFSPQITINYSARTAAFGIPPSDLCGLGGCRGRGDESGNIINYHQRHRKSRVFSRGKGGYCGSKGYIEIQRTISRIMSCSLASLSIPITIVLLSKDKSVGGLSVPRGMGDPIDPAAWVASVDPATWLASKDPASL